MRFHLLTEILRPDELKDVEKAVSLRKSDLSFGPVFSKQWTIVDLGLDPNEEKVVDKMKIPQEVTQALSREGWMISSPGSYASGIAEKTVNGRVRKMRIGSILQTMGDDLAKKALQMFIARAKTETGNTALSANSYWLVVTHRPVDIAGMSTSKSWKSCMDLRDSEGKRTITDNNETVFKEITCGGMVAYVISKKFDNLKDTDGWLDHSAGRVAIKRFVNPDKITDYIFLQEDRTYGDGSLWDRLNAGEKLQELIDDSNEKTSTLDGSYTMADTDSWSDTFFNQIKSLKSLDKFVEFRGKRITLDQVKKYLEKKVRVSEDEVAATIRYMAGVHRKTDRGFDIVEFLFDLMAKFEKDENYAFPMSTRLFNVFEILKAALRTVFHRMEYIEHLRKLDEKSLDTALGFSTTISILHDHSTDMKMIEFLNKFKPELLLPSKTSIIKSAMATFLVHTSPKHIERLVQITGKEHLEDFLMLAQDLPRAYESSEAVAKMSEYLMNLLRDKYPGQVD